MPASPRAVLLTRWWLTFLFSRFLTFFSMIARAACIEVSCDREAPFSKGCFVIAEGILRLATLMMDWRLTSASKTRCWACADCNYLQLFKLPREVSLVGPIENSRTFPPNSPNQTSLETIMHRRLIKQFHFGLLRLICWRGLIGVWFYNWYSCTSGTVQHL